MDFEKFIEEVKNRIKDFLPKQYADAEIYVHEQKKINRQYTGLTVVGKDIANPTINLEAFHGEYENGKFMEDVLYDMLDKEKYPYGSLNMVCYFTVHDF